MASLKTYLRNNTVLFPFNPQYKIVDFLDKKIKECGHSAATPVQIDLLLKRLTENELESLQAQYSAPPFRLQRQKRQKRSLSSLPPSFHHYPAELSGVPTLDYKHALTANDITLPDNTQQPSSAPVLPDYDCQYRVLVKQGCKMVNDLIIMQAAGFFAALTQSHGFPNIYVPYGIFIVDGAKPSNCKGLVDFVRNTIQFKEECLKFASLVFYP